MWISLSENILRELDGIKCSLEERTDFLNNRVRPVVVTYPSRTEEVVKIVNVAREHGLPIVVWGVGTSLAGHLVCDGCILIDMKFMDKIVEINDTEWYVRVQPGLILSKLNEELKKIGFFIPPEPASSFACSVGGVVNNASGGMRSVRYGTFRDWVLALEVVLPSGKVIRVGEPFVKNRAGYDLVHLFVGSEGTLGIVTEIWFKIIPVPEEVKYSIMMELSDFRQGTEIIRELRKNRVVIDVAEYMDGLVAKTINKHFNTNIPESVGGTITLSSSSTYREKIEKILRQHSVTFTEVDEDKTLSERALAGLALKAEWNERVSEDIVVPLSKLDEAFMKIKELEEKSGVKIAILGHIADGNLHPNILISSRDDPRLTKIYDEIGRIAIILGGSISGEHGIGYMKADLMKEQLTAHNGIEVLKIMNDIKGCIDPHHFMNPGKFVELAWSRYLINKD